ncbi:hypothetical protein RSAG8_07036, partial [Rhizoctonia solani AG-8 WAC10335]
MGVADLCENMSCGTTLRTSPYFTGVKIPSRKRVVGSDGETGGGTAGAVT